jgi:hypothetical protein
MCCSLPCGDILFKFSARTVGYLLPQPDISFQPSVSPVRLTPTGVVRGPWPAVSHSILSLLNSFAFFFVFTAYTSNMDYSPFFAQTPQPYQFMGMPPTPTYSGEEKIVSRSTLTFRTKFHFWSSIRPAFVRVPSAQMPIRTLSTLQSSLSPTISVTLSCQPAAQT